MVQEFTTSIQFMRDLENLKNRKITTRRLILKHCCDETDPKYVEFLFYEFTNLYDNKISISQVIENIYNYHKENNYKHNTYFIKKGGENA